jgi:hypothetical protein
MAFGGLANLFFAEFEEKFQVGLHLLQKVLECGIHILRLNLHALNASRVYAPWLNNII